MSLRIAVTGQSGQVVSAMRERAPADVVLLALGRPLLDLARPQTIAPAIAAARADIVVNAAAYTAVDQAETEPDLAFRINAEAAGEVARAAGSLGAPVIQISTDYVFDGMLERPYREDDGTNPLSVYGASKLAGERAVAAATGDHAILRTSWVYAPFGRNFVTTMLRLGETRPEVSVVADQRGAPTSALDLADAIFAMARHLAARPREAALRGVFHASAGGEAVWADVAEAIFSERERLGHRPVPVKRIASAEYPTPARRPANSRLDCTRLAQSHGIELPGWRGSLAACVGRLTTEQETQR